MKTIFIDNTQFTKEKKKTYLTADSVAAGTTLTVQSILGFAINQVLCLGDISEEDCELVQTHGSSAPANSIITLTSSAMVFAHPQDTKVYILDYDQIEISHATTTTGSKSILATINIQPDQKETIYNESAQTSGYYFTRLKNSINTTYSSYSDPIPYAGYTDSTVYRIKERALNSVGEEIGDVITHTFLDECLWQARREFHDSPGKRPFRAIYNYNAGTTYAGQFRLECPTDLDDQFSGVNIFGVRIGKEQNMSYYDKKEWDRDYEGHAWTTLSSAYGTADTTISLTNSKDFPSSGSIKIQEDTIEYSVNDVVNGSLMIDTAGGSAHSSGALVWDNGMGYGLPIYFTAFRDTDGTSYIAFDLPISDTYKDRNIFLDYYRGVSSKDSDADELDEPEYDMYVHYLAWRIKKKKNQGIQAIDDPDYQLWLAKKEQALKNEKTGQKIRMTPNIGHLPIY